MAADAQVEVLDGWSALVRMVPPAWRTRQLPEYLARETGVPVGRVAAVREIRNRIAHEGTYSVPEAQARRAARTIREMQAALVHGNQGAGGAPPPRSDGPGRGAGRGASGARAGRGSGGARAAASPARIVFHRPLRWGNAARSYQLKIDGVPCGRLRVGGELTVEVEPGVHTAEAKVDFSASRPLEFTVRPGEELRIRVVAAGLAGQVSGALRFDWQNMLRLSVD